MNTIKLLCFFLLTFHSFNGSKDFEENLVEIFNDETIGYTPGSFSVSASGTAHYNVPFLFPEGTSGLKPSLSLVYNSSGGDGILGLGWNLQGLSSITRVGQTIDKDYQIDPVDFDSNDRFALNSERLVLISENKEYGADGGEYRVEQNTFDKILSIGESVNGPEKFIVYSKDGLIKEYGHTEDSQYKKNTGEILAWHLNKISDRNGNYILIEYEKQKIGTEDINIVPKYIKYTGNNKTNLAPYVRLELNYFEKFTANSTGLKFVAGKIELPNKILNSVNIQFQENNIWVTKRWYSFTYKNNSIGQYYIIGLNQCVPSKCLNSTNFIWDIFEDETYKENFLQAIDKSYFFKASLNSGDWDGDGYSDILLMRPEGSNTFLQNWKESRGSFQIEKANPIPTEKLKGKTVIPADFNNDGFSDIFAYDPESGSNILFINKKNSFSNLSFSQYDNIIDKEYFNIVGYTNNFGEQKHPKEVQFGDFNGDGFVDIFTYDVAIGLSDFEKTFRAGFTRSHGFHINNCQESINFSSESVQNFDSKFLGNYINWNGISTDFGQIDLQDINGDGLTDIVVFVQTDNPITLENDDGSLKIYYNTGKGNFLDFNNYFSEDHENEIISASILDLSGSGTDALKYGDFNADGLNDILYLYSGDSQGGIIFFNRGDNNPWFTQEITNVFSNNYNVKLNELRVLDYNGDGRADIFTRSSDKKSYRAFSNRITHFQEDFRRNNINELAQIALGSFSNEELIDILILNNPEGASSDYLTSYSISAKPDGKITSIEEGHGKKIEIEYTSLLNPQVYEKYDDGLFPMYDFISNMMVANRYCITDGIGGKNCVNYKFYGGKLHLNGRGFRGFEKVEITDETLGITTTNKYFQDYRLLTTPLKNSTKTRVGSNKSIGEQVSNVPYQEDNNGTIVFPQIIVGGNDMQYYFTANARSFTFNYDLSNNLISKSVTRDSFEFTSGNLIRRVLDYGEGYKDSIINYYEDNIDEWLLGRLSRAEVYKFSPENTTVKRSSEFDYDPVTGQLIMEKTNPDFSAEMQVVTNYQYDKFGNTVKKSVSFFNGYEFETRNIYKEYDERGRFVIAVSNDLEHTKMMEHDDQFGYLLSTTDENGLITQYEYDEFGRLIRELYPDGNWSKTQINKCNDCPKHAFLYKVDSSSISPPITTYFDTLGREIRTNTIDFNGEVVYHDITFNERGLVRFKSQPYKIGDNKNETEYFYDDLGREVAKQLPGGQYPFRDFFDQSRTIQSLDVMSRGSQTSQDIKGHVVRSMSENQTELKFTYNGQGDLTKASDTKGNAILYAYDVNGYKTSMDDPDMGIYEYKYNPLGEMYWMKDPEGNETSYYYDNIGRLIQRVELDGITKWVYDVSDNGIGLLHEVMSEYHSKKYFYDSLSRPRRATEIIGSKSYTTYTIYNEKSQIDKITYPNGFALKYLYNNQEYLEEIRDYKSNQLYWKADAVNHKGQLLKQKVGNGIETSFEYDDKNNWLNSIVTENPFNGDKIQDLHYQYNPAGQIVERNDLINNEVTKYTYDILYRLTKVDQTGLDPLNMQYDDLGNITYKSDVGKYYYGENGAGPHQLTRIDELVNPCIPSYEVNIDYTSYDKVQEIIKDSLRLEISYGSSRQRIEQRKYLKDNLIETKTYIGGLLEIIVTDSLHREVNLIKSQNGTFATHITDIKSDASEEYIEYWHRDHQGSLQTITNQTGEIISNFQYDPWGLKKTSQDESNAQNLERGYTGHEHLDYFGLINMNGRMYDPVLARFISPDPFIQDPLNLQNYNRYSYVLNDPINLVDPSGYFLKKLGRNLYSGVKKIGQAHIDLFYRKPFDIVNRAGKKTFGEKAWTTIAVTTTTVVVNSLVSTVFGPIAGSAAGGFAGAFIGARIAGADFESALKAGLVGAAIGAVTSYASAELGALDISSPLLKKGVETVGNGIVQGGIADIQGGNFGDAFNRSALTSTTNSISNELLGSYNDNSILKHTIIAVDGGVISEINGDNFMNGAITSTYANMLGSATVEFVNHSNSNISENESYFDVDKANKDIEEGNVLLTAELSDDVLEFTKGVAEIGIGSLLASSPTGIGQITGYAIGVHGAIRSYNAAKKIFNENISPTIESTLESVSGSSLY